MSPEGFAKQFLAVPVAIDIGSIEEVTSQFQRPPDCGQRLFVVGRPITVPVGVAAYRPRTEAHFANLESRLSQNSILHLRFQERPIRVNRLTLNEIDEERTRFVPSQQSASLEVLTEAPSALKAGSGLISKK